MTSMSLQGLREHDGTLTEVEDPGGEQPRMLRVWVERPMEYLEYLSSRPTPALPHSLGRASQGSFNGFSCYVKGSVSLALDSKPIPPLSCRFPSLWHDHAARPNSGGGVNPVLGAWPGFAAGS